MSFWNYVIPDGSTTGRQEGNRRRAFWNYVIPDGSTSHAGKHWSGKVFWNYIIPINYTTNTQISDKPPIEYVGMYRARLGEEAYHRTCRENALPENFETFTYPDFLAERRKLMAGIIRQGYERLCL